MKNIFILSAAFFATACTNDTKVKGVKDTIEVTQPKATVEKKTTSTSTTSSTNSSADGTTETTSAKKTNTGWSKTAKGTVIGGVVGAGTGAVVNKKNRAAGAVVGGVVGAGTGAIIGNELDKKDGRH